MYTRTIYEHDLMEVAELERATYPEEMCLGYEDYLHDLRTCDFNCSKGVFKDGKLIGYIIAYRNRSDYTNSMNGVYVSDLVCKNPKALLHLLFAFLSNLYSDSFYGEFRKSSYDLIRNAIKKREGFLRLVSAKKLENYYENGEDAYQLRLQVGDIRNLTFREAFLYYLNSRPFEGMTYLEPVIRRVLETNLRNPITGEYEEVYSIDDVEKHRKFILREINERNLDCLKMIGPDFNLVGEYSKKFRNGKCENYVKKLEEAGFTLDNSIDPHFINERKMAGEAVDKRYVYYSRQNDLRWYHYTKLDNTKYDDGTLSYYRWKIRRDVIRYYKKKKAATRVFILDRHRRKHLSIIIHKGLTNVVPYNTSVTFNHLVKKYRFKRRVSNEVYGRLGHDSYYNFMEPAVEMRKLLGEEFALGFITRLVDTAIRLRDENDTDYASTLHDWLYLIRELLEKKNYLTKGAYRTLFSEYSLNQMMKVNEQINRLNVEYINLLDEKELRKEISKRVRKSLEIETYLDEALGDYDEMMFKKYRIKKSLQSRIGDFISRMTRYATGVSLATLFKVFNKEATLKMIEGTYPGLFEEKEYFLDRKPIGEFVQKCLGRRGVGSLVRRPKKLYTALNRIQPVDDILKGVIKDESIPLILHELKQRHVEIPDHFYELNRFKGKIEPKCSPEYLIAGNASVCCMSFGRDNATTYALEEGFGVFNIYYKERVIANSVIWINDVYNALIIDNIEVHPNYVHLNSLIKKLYFQMIDDLTDAYDLDFALQGYHYNDLRLYKGRDSYRVKIEARNVKSNYFYTDASYVHPLPIKGVDKEKDFARLVETIRAAEKSVAEEKVVQPTAVQVLELEGDDLPF